MRVLFISCDPLDGAVTRYRCTHLAEALKSAGHSADVATIYDPVIRLEHDIVVLHRICANQEGQALADAVRKSGATLIYGADDLVWEEGPLAHLHLAMLKQADGVLVSTNALAELAEEVGAKEIAVVRNIADDSKLLSSRGISLNQNLWLKAANVKILYAAGTPTHDRDLLEVAQSLQQCLAKYPTMSLVFMGPLTVSSVFPEERVLKLPLRDWGTYLCVIQHCTIVIAPLEKARFNRGKSEIKWQEAALCGRPVVASNWGGFAEVIQDGKDGFLAANSEEWVAKLERLIEENETGYNPLREEIGGCARQRLGNLRVQEAERTIRYFVERLAIGERHAGNFPNPRGFAKGIVKKTLRRLKV
ncbi:glycosyltransferase [Armatimonas sp.]|uniref:glycosyltransferase n=1 Tax=Armatimonas sp. TaxID=1872638 RepID=UPI00286CBBA3|nr:glycosyltransferase [Armatimonas sp.]